MAEIGRIAFPRRWPLWKNSWWNIACRSGNVYIHKSAAKKHTGRDAYLDPKTEIEAHRSLLDETVQIIVEQLTE